MQITSINVLKEHIDKGEQNEYNSCPLALAVSDFLRTTLPDTSVFKGVEIHDCNASVHFNDRSDHYIHMGENFVHAFDNGHEVEPFTCGFEFEGSTEPGGVERIDV